MVMTLLKGLKAEMGGYTRTRARAQECAHMANPFSPFSNRRFLDVTNCFAKDNSETPPFSNPSVELRIRRNVTTGDHEVTTANIHPEGELPYGKWTCADGREVLFTRDYIPLYQRSPDGAVMRADPSEWVKFQGQEFFYDGRPNTGAAIVRKQKAALARWGIEHTAPARATSATIKAKVLDRVAASPDRLRYSPTDRQWTETCLGGYDCRIQPWDVEHRLQGAFRELDRVHSSWRHRSHRPPSKAALRRMAERDPRFATPRGA